MKSNKKIRKKDICEYLKRSLVFLYGREFVFSLSKSDKDLFEAEISTCKIVISRSEFLDKTGGIDRIKFVKEKYNKAVKEFAEKALVLQDELKKAKA